MSDSQEQINQRLVQGLAESDIRAQLEAKRIFLLGCVNRGIETLKNDSSTKEKLKRLGVVLDTVEEHIQDKAAHRLEQIETEPIVGPAEIVRHDSDVDELANLIKGGKLLGWVSARGEIELPLFQFDGELVPRTTVLTVNTVLRPKVPALPAFMWWMDHHPRYETSPRDLLVDYGEDTMVRSALIDLATERGKSRIGPPDL